MTFKFDSNHTELYIDIYIENIDMVMIFCTGYVSLKCLKTLNL